MPIGEAVDSVRQIIGGLEAAQRLGILHRDARAGEGDLALSRETAGRAV
jgi:hypothetical protein